MTFHGKFLILYGANFKSIRKLQVFRQLWLSSVCLGGAGEHSVPVLVFKHIKKGYRVMVFFTSVVFSSI